MSVDSGKKRKGKLVPTTSLIIYTVKDYLAYTLYLFFAARASSFFDFCFVLFYLVLPLILLYFQWKGPPAMLMFFSVFFYLNVRVLVLF